MKVCRHRVVISAIKFNQGSKAFSVFRSDYDLCNSLLIHLFLLSMLLQRMLLQASFVVEAGMAGALGTRK